MAIKENIPNQGQGPDPTKPMQLVCRGEVVRKTYVSLPRFPLIF